jgi:dipeptidyl-peptidase 4
MNHPHLRLLACLPLLSCASPAPSPPVAPPADPVDSAPQEDAASPKTTLTLEQAFGGGERVRFSGRAPSWRWASDGVHLVSPEGDWVNPETWEKRKAPKKKDEAREERKAKQQTIEKALAQLEGIEEKDAGKIAGSSIDRTAEGTVTLLGRRGRLWIHREGEGARELDPRGTHDLERLAPDGRHLVFLRDHDIFLLSTVTGELRALTEDGGPDRFNGRLDWVYQEEIYGRGDFRAFWWSPDSQRIAFLSLDESPVHEFTLIDHIESDHHRVKPEITHYPKAGDPNPIVKLGVVEVASGETTWIDLSRYEESEPLVVRVGWAPDGRGTFMVQDRIQTWADFNAFDPATGEWETLIRETSDSWVNRPRSPHWFADGSFLWTSDRTDERHLYHHAADGTLIGAVTAGEWSVGRILEIDEAGGRLWFTSTRDGAVNGNVYRGSLEGGEMVRLTSGEGQHRVSFDGSHDFYVDRYSSLSVPPSVRLCRGDGEIVRELGRAAIPHREKYATSDWKLVEIEARDGFPLDVAYLPPVPFDAERPHPVWLTTYSGPAAPSVANRWNGGVWAQFLAQQGIVVLQVNVRTASGKGHGAIEECYRQLGVQELRDLEDAVEWLCDHRWADASRVGITGHSYGGTMTAFALTHSDAFALGVAGSGVYDWRMYDSVYTERYMSTPQLNPTGYAAASIVAAAKDLTGHLVITHGTMDENVHLQNVMHFIHALQRAGKMNFELMLYPQSRHGIRDSALRRHSQLLEWGAIEEHLLAEKP